MGRGYTFGYTEARILSLQGEVVQKKTNQHMGDKKMIKNSLKLLGVFVLIILFKILSCCLSGINYVLDKINNVITKLKK